MTRPNLWAKHYQSVWLERSVDPRNPAWIRCAALAYGLVEANGHAPMQPGELAEVLGRPGKAMQARDLRRVIKHAVEMGWLAPASFARCLVVPSHAVEMSLGDGRKSCKLVHPARQGGANLPLQEGVNLPPLQAADLRKREGPLDSVFQGATSSSTIEQESNHGTSYGRSDQSHDGEGDGRQASRLGAGDGR